MMAFPPRKETYESNTLSDLSSRTSRNGALHRRSSKGTTIQSYRGSITNSSVHNTSTAATRRARKDPFNRPGQGSLYSESSSGHGNCPTISDHKSFHHLRKSTSTLQNQSPSTETTWSYQAPVSRPQEPVSLPQEPISRSQATRSKTSEHPIHSRYTLEQLPPVPISLPQEPISRLQGPVSLPQGPISWPQEPVSRPQATGPSPFEQPIHSHTDSYTSKQLPPPATIPLSQPNPYLHPVPRLSRTRPPQPHQVVYDAATYDSDPSRLASKYVIIPPNLRVGVSPQIRIVTPTKRSLVKRLFTGFGAWGVPSSGSSPKPNPPSRRHRRSSF